MKFFVDNWYLIVMAVISGSLLFVPGLRRRAGTGSGAVTPAEAVQLINREKAVLIDIREPGEYAAGHPINAKNVPLATLEASTVLPKNKALPVVVVCASGTRASKAVTMLRKLGFENARPMAGGLKAWRDASLPVEKTA